MFYYYTYPGWLFRTLFDFKMILDKKFRSTKDPDGAEANTTRLLTAEI